MKKTITLCAVLAACIRLVALPLGNPWDASLLTDGLICENRRETVCDPCPSWYETWSVRLGFYGDYVFGQKLEQASDPHSTVAVSKVNTSGVSIALNFCDRFDIFTTLGASNLYYEHKAIVDAHYYVSTNTSFSWSLGLRATLLEWKCWGLGAEAQYFRTQPVINYSGYAGSERQYLNDSITYQEWQVGGGLAYRFNLYSDSTALVPYVGVKWNGCRLSVPSIIVPSEAVFFSSFQLRDLRKDVQWGYAVGLTLVGCDRASITVEGRFRDQTAVHVNGQVRF